MSFKDVRDFSLFQVLSQYKFVIHCIVAPITPHNRLLFIQMVYILLLLLFK